MADIDFLDRVFHSARTYANWLDKAVSPELLSQVYDLVKMAPTSVNCMPARFVFLSSPEAKARLLPALVAANVEKARAAPVTVIVASDTRFYERIPHLFHHRPEAMQPFLDNAELAETTAFRNSTLQGGYFILAARAVGLDCGPMSGFDHAMVDAEFFADGRLRSNFLVNLGYGDESMSFPRLPRLSVDEACTFL